jgi:hypothetical protein
MRKRILYPILALVMFVSSAQAQIGDWQDVEDLPPDTVISVQTGYRYPVRCMFEYATDRILFCAVAYRSRLIEPHEMRLDRSEISQVSFDNGERNTAKGALIGGGIGAAIGASPDPGRSGYTRLGGAVLLGLIGGAVGHVIAMDHPHYRVIYKR